MADYWQLETSADRWLLEDGSGLWLLEVQTVEGAGGTQLCIKTQHGPDNRQHNTQPPNNTSNGTPPPNASNQDSNGVLIMAWIEAANNTIRARITQAGSLIVAGDVSTIQYAAYDQADTQITARTGLTPVATYIFAEKTRADDLDWCDNNEGFNFQFDVPATAFPTGKTKVTVEVKITMDDATVGWLKVTDDVTAIIAAT